MEPKEVQVHVTYDVRNAGNKAPRFSARIENIMDPRYDDWGNVSSAWQEHDGDVDNDGQGSDTAKVGYSFDDSLNRLQTVTYPTSRTVRYDYGTTGEKDDRLSRIESITNGADTETYAAYTYLGTGTIVGIAHAEVTGGLKLNYGSSGTYGGFDQFGRVISQLWENNASTTTFDEYTYVHDAMGNRTSRDNELHADFDETYAYDEVYRLIGSERERKGQALLTATA